MDLLAEGGRGKKPCFVKVQKKAGPGARNTGDLEKEQYSCWTWERGQSRYFFTTPGHGHLYLKSEDLLLSAPKPHPFPVGHSENEDIFTFNEFQAPAEHWRNKVSHNRFSKWTQCEGMSMPSWPNNHALNNLVHCVGHLQTQETRPTTVVFTSPQSCLGAKDKVWPQRVQTRTSRSHM